MGTKWTASADKHGVDHADAIHAMVRRIIYVRGFDESRDGGRQRPDLFIGPGRDGELLEVMALVDVEHRDALVFHVMKARRSTVERARQILRDREATS